MKKIRVTYLALGAYLSAVSCTQEATEPDVYDWAAGEIFFKTSLTDVASSRADDMTLDRLESFQVTCFNTGEIEKDAEGFILPYFKNATFIRQTSPVGFAYISAPAEGPLYWPEKAGLLSFFAFSPSCDVMAADNSAVTDTGKYFNLINTTKEDNSRIVLGYRLDKVRVNPDIASQFDFVTAGTSGERWKDFNNGVQLAFRHQMSQVELKAWGASPYYNFEIAGVCLGNPVVEGTFAFAGSSTGWTADEDAVKDKVEYTYRSTYTNDNIPGSGDKIFRINHDEHNTADLAQSIMGNGGCAMVIPTVNPRWEGLSDPNIGASPYTTSRMYFSILLRVINKKGGKTIYPYPDNPYGMTVIYYAVDQSGAIVSRLYPGQKEDEYFTDATLLHPYMAAEGEEVKEFGWAAVPVDADWSAGKRYVYTLNYSEGIGLHDPQDPDPGTPIAMISAPVSWGVTVDTWHDAEKNDDFDPDVNVP